MCEKVHFMQNSMNQKIKKIVSKIYNNRRIGIPKKIWNFLNLHEEDYVIWEIIDNKVIIKKNEIEKKPYRIF